MFFGRNDAKAETPVLWLPHAKSWLIGKETDAGRDWGQEEKGMTEDEMAGWRHWLDGLEFEWTPGVGDGQGGLVCCNSWGRKESDSTERLNWTELRLTVCNRKYSIVFCNWLSTIYVILNKIIKTILFCYCHFLWNWKTNDQIIILITNEIHRWVIIIIFKIFLCFLEYAP